MLPSARSPEISIVLNLHNEARFLRRTMMSIGEAVSFAAPYGISCEIVCVLDRPDPSTRAWIEAYDFSRFADRLSRSVTDLSGLRGMRESPAPEERTSGCATPMI